MKKTDLQAIGAHTMIKRTQALAVFDVAKIRMGSRDFAGLQKFNDA